MIGNKTTRYTYNQYYNSENQRCRIGTVDNFRDRTAKLEEHCQRQCCRRLRQRCGNAIRVSCGEHHTRRITYSPAYRQQCRSGNARRYLVYNDF